MSKILAMDSSSVSCSAAIGIDGKIIAAQYINNGLTHSQTLLCAVEQVLALAGTDIGDLDKIAVTTGPGAVTGIKIGAVTAKGLAYPKNIECVAVSSLEAAAYNGIYHKGKICAVMDARRNQLYNALFTSEDGTLLRLTSDRRIDKNELLHELDENTLIVGDASEMFHGINILVSSQEKRYVNAENIIQIVESGGGISVNHKKLVPFYLRAPQAERERFEKKENQI